MSAPRAVLYTTPFSEIFGGGQESLLALLATLDRGKYRPVVLVPAEGKVARRARELGCEVRVLMLPPLRSGLAAARSIFALRRLLASEKIDLIHTDGPRSTLYSDLARRGLGIPLVWHIRNMETDGLLDRYLEKRADRIILVARRLESRFSSSARARCAVAHNGVDLKPAPKASLTGLPAPSSPLIVCPGRLDGGPKGQHILLEALTRVHEDAAATVWFVGEEDRDYGLRLRERASELGIQDYVHFLGFREDARSLMALADLVVLPSLREGFPRVLLEAMAESKALVATNVGGIPELVDDGETGLLVPAADAEALASAIRTLLTDPGRRQSMGREGRRRAEGFSPEASARAVEAVYAELLGSTS